MRFCEFLSCLIPPCLRPRCMQMALTQKENEQVKKQNQDLLAVIDETRRDLQHVLLKDKKTQSPLQEKSAQLDTLKALIDSELQ